MCHGLYVGCGLCVMVGYMIYVCLSMHVSMVGGEGDVNVGKYVVWDL